MKRGKYPRTAETRAKTAAASRRNWQDPEFRKRVTAGLSYAMGKAWADNPAGTRRRLKTKYLPPLTERRYREKVRRVLGAEAARDLDRRAG